MKILAIDLGKFKSVACLHTDAAEDADFQTVDTSRETFRQLLVQSAADIVVFETCTAAGWLADLCDELGLKFAIANPNGEAWRWKNIKRKTDRDDALKLARLYYLKELPTVYMPSYETRSKRSLLKFRERVISHRVAVQNEIRALFQAQGINLARGGTLWTKAGREMLRAECRDLAECGPTEFWRGQLKFLVDSLDHLTTQENDLERKLDALATKDVNVKRLMTIPGVGRCTAEVVCAYIDDAKRFHNGREVSSYAGMVPRQYQSGEQDRRGRISKSGPKLLRKRLVECSWLLLRYNPWGAQLHHKLSRGQKTRKKQAAVAVARRLLVRCWAMLRDGTDWNEQLATVT
ncbi:MAG: IS110 family transposase [Fuerstiella sp.]